MLEYLHEDVSLIGASKVQYISGKRDMECFLIQLNFKKYDKFMCEFVPIWEDDNACLMSGKLVLKLTNTSEPPVLYNRYTVMWVKTKSGYKVLHIHVSNPQEGTGAVVGYKNFGTRTFERYRSLSQGNLPDTEKISIKTTSSVYYQLYPCEIICIEADNKHTIYHTTVGQLIVKQKISDIALLDKFIKPHRSYIINTDYIESIEKYKINLCDYMSIPIPFKRYSEIRSEILSILYSRESVR